MEINRCENRASRFTHHPDTTVPLRSFPFFGGL
jgi:hypothetical protein